eukprot:9170966-Alexandrium_andersonii.AAC.1
MEVAGPLALSAERPLRRRVALDLLHGAVRFHRRVHGVAGQHVAVVAQDVLRHIRNRPDRPLGDPVLPVGLGAAG